MKRVLVITASILLLALMPVGVYANEIIEESDCEMVTAVSEETTTDDTATTADIGKTDSGSSDIDEQTADDTTQEESTPEEPAAQDEQLPLVTEEAKPAPTAEQLPAAENKPTAKPSPSPIDIAAARIAAAISKGEAEVNLKDLGIVFSDSLYEELMKDADMDNVGTTSIVEIDGKLDSVLIEYGYEDDEEDKDEENESSTTGAVSVKEETAPPAAKTEPAPSVIEEAKAPSSAAEESTVPAAADTSSNSRKIPADAPVEAMSVSMLIAGIFKYLLQ